MSKQFFYHYHLVTLIGTGAMGTWCEGVITGERFLVPSPGRTDLCVGYEPIWDEDNDPCQRCGWSSNVIKAKETWPTP